MSSKLFLVCPAGQSEHKIRYKYEGNLYFLTALGGVFDMSDAHYASSVIETIQRESIKEVYVVSDTACMFINSIIHHKFIFPTKAEKQLADLFKSNQYIFNNAENLLEKAALLAELNIKQELHKLSNNPLLKDEIIKNNISLHGILLTGFKSKMISVDTHREFAA